MFGFLSKNFMLTLRTINITFNTPKIMRSEIRSIYEIEKELKTNYPKLTEFEILSLAVQIERNEILENGLVVSRNDRTPSGLEAIVRALLDR